MSEPKPMASLSSGLLARKGDARPAMRRAYVPMTSVASLPVSLQNEEAFEELHDDLGWNDMGEDVHVPAPVVSKPALKPVVVRQQERIVKSFKAVRASAQPHKAKKAFTLRLDAERHLSLRLACAVGNRSAQQIVTQALDEFLENQPELAALLAQAPKSAAQN